MFDPHRALEIAREFAFPRLSGSAGNGRAAEQILQTLESSQIKTQSQSFQISHLPTRFLRGALVIEVALLAGRLVYPDSDLPSLFLLIFAAALFTSQAWIDLGVACCVLESSQTDCNVTTEVLGHGDREILFVAHHDSKSQGLSILTRILAFSALAIGHSVAVVPLFVDNSATLAGVSTAGTWVALSFSLLLVTLGNGNRSCGALDNASGVGVVLALAEAIKRSPIPGLRIRFLFSGGEELGLQGASRFVMMNDDAEKTVVNIDTVGAGKLLWLYGSRGRLRNGLRQAARRSGLAVVSPPMLFGMLADHVPFVRSGREAITMTLVSPMLRFLHTERDGATALSLEAFESVSRLLEKWFASDDVA